jgi:hypothetical protein
LQVPLSAAKLGASIGTAHERTAHERAEMKKPVPPKSAPASITASATISPSASIDEKIKQLGDWRGKTLAKVRKLIHDADPDILEEWKWMGTPVFSHDGIVCTGESYKKVVKLTFAKGASLKDPAHLFNSSLDGNVRRAIDIHEKEVVDESAFKALVRQAVALNSSGKSKPKSNPKSKASKKVKS